jgi:transcriptional regulator with XRE-family HTH domain
MNADPPVSKAGTPAGEEGASTSARVRTMLDLQRSEFLRMCRTRIRPEDVGLPTSQRARTDGLRREDVAVLAGVSVSWYTWLEQGRDIRISEDVLERICLALRLTEDERTYLFSLVQGRVPRMQGGSHSEAPPDVERMLQEIGVPAYALNMRWDVLAWNAQTAAIYRDYSTLPDEGRNLMEILLTQPARHQDAAQQEAMVQRLCARLRYDYSKNADDPEFEALVQRLRARSPLFNRFWQAPDFNLRAYGAHRFAHHRFGDVTFEHTSYVPDGYPDIRVVICTPADDATRRVVAEVNAELAQA